MMKRMQCKNHLALSLKVILTSNMSPAVVAEEEEGREVLNLNW